MKATLVGLTVCTVSGCVTAMQPSRPTYQFAMRPGTEASIREKLSDESALDPIEGIWHMAGRYRVGSGPITPFTARLAILRDSLIPGQEFVEINLDPANGFPMYAVTAEFVRAAEPGVYIARQLSGDGSATVVRMNLNASGALVGEIQQPYDGQTVTTAWEYTKLEPRSAVSSAARPRSTTGSGFLADSTGRFVTNHHVVEGATEIVVVLAQDRRTYNARVLTRDVANDLAVLQLEEFQYGSVYTTPFPIRFSQSSSSVGEDVFTIGYPLGDVLGGTPRLSAGHISSQYGLDDDPRLFQISNPLQPGNSGGPLFNTRGELVGVVVSTLNAAYFYERGRIIPQNVNFAVKSRYVQALFPAHQSARRRSSSVTIERLAHELTPFVGQVRAQRTHPRR